LVGHPWDPLHSRFNESRAVSADKNKQTPYHPELNPIEKMWAMVKNWVAMKNVTLQLQDVRKLAEEKFSSITRDEWLPVCKHVEEMKEKYIQNEHLVDNIPEELVIILESSDSDMSEEDEDNSLKGILPLSSDSE
jgi:hypothetical protein